MLIYVLGGTPLVKIISNLFLQKAEESLEDYINLALNLSGSAFRVELTAVPANIPLEAVVTTHKVPKASCRS